MDSAAPQPRCVLDLTATDIGKTFTLDDRPLVLRGYQVRRNPGGPGYRVRLLVDDHPVADPVPGTTGWVNVDEATTLMPT